MGFSQAIKEFLTNEETVVRHRVLDLIVEKLVELEQTLQVSKGRNLRHLWDALKTFSIHFLIFLPHRLWTHSGSTPAPFWWCLTAAPAHTRTSPCQSWSTSGSLILPTQPMRAWTTLSGTRVLMMDSSMASKTSSASLGTLKPGGCNSRLTISRETKSMFFVLHLQATKGPKMSAVCASVSQIPGAQIFFKPTIIF